MSEGVTRGKVLNVCSKIGFGTIFTIILPLLTALILKLASEVPTLTGYGTSILKTDTSKFAFRLRRKYDKF